MMAPVAASRMVVTPTRAASSVMAWMLSTSSRRLSLSMYLSRTHRTHLAQDPVYPPVGVPAEVPPGGSGASSVMPAISRAFEFT